MTYDPQYSFASYAALNPGKPLPGASLDAELGNIATSVAALATALDEVRRDDGRLNNDTVTFDSLTADVRRSISPLLGASVGEITELTAGLRTAAGIFPKSIASQAEAEGGASHDKFVTPLRTAQAISAQRPFATQPEAIAATALDVVLSPGAARDTVDALRPFASTEDAQAAAAAGSVLSPARGADLVGSLRRATSTTVTLTWGTATAGGATAQTVTVTGATAGDRVALGFPTIGPEVGLVPVAWVSAPDTVTVRMQNVTGADIVPFAGLAVDTGVTVIGF